MANVLIQDPSPPLSLRSTRSYVYACVCVCIFGEKKRWSIESDWVTERGLEAGSFDCCILMGVVFVKRLSSRTLCVALSSSEYVYVCVCLCVQSEPRLFALGFSSRWSCCARLIAGYIRVDVFVIGNRLSIENWHLSQRTGVTFSSLRRGNVSFFFSRYIGNRITYVYY